MPAALNCSDHLLITMMLRLPHATIGTPDPLPKRRVNCFKEQATAPCIPDACVLPLIGHSYGCCEDLDKEISLVSDEICSAAERILPLCQTAVRKKEWHKDQTLSRLAAQKKAAWDEWSTNGRPKEGTLYEAKIRTRADFRKRLRVCVANSERRRGSSISTSNSNGVPQIDSSCHQGGNSKVQHCVLTNKLLPNREQS